MRNKNKNIIKIRTLVSLLKEYQETIKLEEKIPALYEISRDIKIIDWKDDFPREGGGIAFFDTKEVAFPTHPRFDIIIHELGHIAFQVPDVYWHRSWGGAEMLVHLCLAGKIETDYAKIRWYIRMLEELDIRPENVYQFILETIPQKIKVYPHLYTISIYGGVIPDEMEISPLMEDLSSPSWGNIIIKDIKSDIFKFFQNIIAGLEYEDNISRLFAKELLIID